MILNDITELFYAPQTAFKRIVENPKYIGAIIVLILFIGLQVGYEYSQFSKTYTEQTTPGIDQLPIFINSTVWRSAPTVTLSNNFNDYANNTVYVAGFGLPPNDPNSYYNLYGNSSLEISASNTNTVSAALDSAFNVDCGTNGFRNLTLIVKQVQPTGTPQSAVITLYALGDKDYYQYDLKPQLSNPTQWNNLTLTLGPNATGWTPSGNPTWSNITALKLDFTYPSSQNITIRIGALFFHGQYLTPVQYNSTGVLLQFVQLFSLQFLFTWFILTGLVYVICRFAFKIKLIWKPLFVALGIAIFVMVIRAIIDLAATATMPTVYYPFDLALGLRFDPFAALYYPTEAVKALPATSQTIFSNIDSATQTFRTIVTVIFAIAYVWLGALGVVVIGVLAPQLSFVKRIVASAVSLAAVVLLLLFLVGSV